VSLKRLFLPFLLCVPACSWFNSPRTTPSEPAPTTRASRPKADGIPTDTRDLFEAYEKDVVKANKDYQDKVLILEGTVYQADGNGSPPFVQLYGGVPGGGSFIRCHFDATDQASVAEVKPGANISIKGRCIGALNNFVTLDGCTILRLRNPK
jgi:hypothetical protein